MPQRLKSDSTSESNDLRNAGLKVTLPRLKILDILADGTARHMSAEDIYKKLLAIRVRTTITSCVWTAARSKSSWTVESKSARTRWQSVWGSRSAIMR